MNSFIKTAVLGPLTGNAYQYERFGLEAPRGILFYGAPGTGKTRLAQALSNEIAKILGKYVHFIYRKGNDVASKYFGESSLNLRVVFEEAIQMKPSVIFFDELDGLCPSRDKPHMTEAYVTIVTTMLGLMDELPRGEVFVIGATNRMGDIDPALLRPGRFDKYLEFQPPSEQGRLEILFIHCNKWKKKPTYEMLKQLSQDTNGFSGADLAKLCLDSFDQALTREIEVEKTRTHIFSYSDLKLQGLTVTMDDWTNALKKIKPSSAGVFGSTLFAPQSNAFCANYIRPLLEANLQRVAATISGILSELVNSGVHSATGIIHAVYIWYESESTLSSIHDYIMTPMFRLCGRELNDHPKYWLSTEMLYDTSTREWPRKVNDAFSQAISAHRPAILYIPSVNDLFEAIGDHQMTEAVNMKRQLERLRGTQVLLVTAGSTCPATFSSGGNPFQVLSSEATKLEISISDDDRGKFFSQMKLPKELQKQWQEDDRNCLTAIYKQVVQEYTKDQEVGSIVSLFDDIRHAFHSFVLAQHGQPIEEDKKYEILKSIGNIVRTYSRTRALVNEQKISHMFEE